MWCYKKDYIKYEVEGVQPLSKQSASYALKCICTKKKKVYPDCSARVQRSLRHYDSCAEWIMHSAGIVLEIWPLVFMILFSAKVLIRAKNEVKLIPRHTYHLYIDLRGNLIPRTMKEPST